MDTSIVTALVGASSLLIAAVIGYLASASEPRSAKELRALNDIIAGLEVSEARTALEGRRDRVAKAYGARNVQVDPLTVAFYIFVAGAGMIFLALAVSGAPSNWAGLRLIAIIALDILGFALILTAVTGAGSIVVKSLRRWLRRRHRPSVGTASESVSET